MIKSQNKGSALLITLLLSIALGATVGSLLNMNLLEFRNTERFVLNLKAQNASESILQQGLAELFERWADGAVPEPNELLQSPLTINSQLNTIFNNTGLALDSFSLLSGDISDYALTHLSATDPANQFDPQKGKSFYASNVKLYARASGNFNNSAITSYAQITFQIRDIPILTHAVFYNMDLEFHPGPDMHITGPVHTNGNIYADGYYLNQGTYFHDPVTAAGKYYRGFAGYHPASYSAGGDIYFKNAAEQWVKDYKGSGSIYSTSSYYDSRYIDPKTRKPDWAAKASELFAGNLQSHEHGVQKLSITGFEDYVRDDPDTRTLDDDLNYAYALIEPNLKVKGKLNHPDYKGENESEKFAYNSGLIVRIYNQKSTPSSLAHNISSNYWITFHHLKRSNTNNPFSEPSVSGGEVEEYDLKVDSKFVNKAFVMEEYDEDKNGKPSAGLYDLRRKRGISTLEFDVDEFRKAVDDTHNKYDSSTWETSSSHQYKPEKDYNGLIYFEFPFSTSSSNRKDKIVTSIEGLGLFIKNAEKVPQPSYNNASDRMQGFTIATNNTVYIKGHFNADGKESTGSNTEPDSILSPEPPAAIAADSITLLSNKFDKANSKSSTSSRSTSFTEVNAALFQGIMPTNKEGNNRQSGGLHNFTRLLEDWDNVTLTYRGAMMCLFESEIANQPASGSYYDPPFRNFGYYSEFGKGKFPPGIPQTRTFQVVDFRFLSKEEYDLKVADLGSNNVVNNVLDTVNNTVNTVNNAVNNTVNTVTEESSTTESTTTTTNSWSWSWFSRWR